MKKILSIVFCLVNVSVWGALVSPYVTADFIYWKARQDGLNYVATGLTPDQGKGKFHEVEASGHPGFKAGLGLQLGHDDWDVYLQYTWLYSDESDDFNGQFGRDLIGDIIPGDITHSRAHWDLHFNAVDLEWGRLFCMSPFVTFRPFFGLKGFWSDQDFDVKSRSALEEHHSRFDEDVWGIGIRGGLQMTFAFTDHWSLFGNLALAAEWSRFHLKLKEVSRTRVLIHFDNDQYRMVPVLELAVGLRWQLAFCEEAYRISAQAGWEEQMWWNFADSYLPFNQGFNGGDLNFQGLTLRFRFAF